MSSGFLTRKDNGQHFPLTDGFVSLDSFMTSADQDRARVGVMLSSVPPPSQYGAEESKNQARFIEIVNKMYTRHPYTITTKIVPELKVGARVVKRDKDLRLELSPFYLRLPPDKQEAVLKHEALHIQLDRHDANFRFHARLHGAVFTGADLFKIPYSLFIKTGRKTQEKIPGADYDDYDKAMIAAKRYLHEHHGQKLIIEQVLPPEVKEFMNF